MAILNQLAQTIINTYRHEICESDTLEERRAKVYKYLYNYQDQCKHQDVRLVFLDKINGTRAYQWQCQACFHLSQWIGKNTIDIAKAVPRVEIDFGELQQALRFERESTTDEIKTRNNKEWWDWYNQYLLTPQWKNIRDRVLRRASFRCEGCGVAPATSVHHLTYKRVGKEMLFDLVAVCQKCHDEITESERVK